MRVAHTLTTLLVLFVSVSAQVTYVDKNAIGSQTGVSWADAYSDLQAALQTTTAGEIWVAQGTYFPGATGQRSATFQLLSGVAVYGGFDGTEVTRSQRDVGANITVLSGDIDQNDTYGSGLAWWHYGWTGSSGNSYHIVTGTGVDATGLLDGVTIRAGRGDEPGALGGAGLIVDGGSPTIRQCTFQYNALGFGSSARLENCNSVFENCVIKDAYSCNCGSGGRTSGVICLSGSNVTFTDCDFQNHYYVSSQGQGRGAALSIDFGCNSTLIRCRFVGNQTGNFYPNGGGTAYGAAVFAAGSVVAENCQFLDNFAHAGAGLTAWSDATITNCLFARNRAVSHPEGNGSIGNYGAGLLTLGYQSSHNIVVTNCTFVDNNCNKGAGAAFYGASDAQVRNCIFYHNYADSASPGEDPIWILKQQIVGNYDLTNCCVEGLLQTEPNEDPPPAANFPSCFDMPPLLVNVAGQNYRQQASSPCIGSGDSSFVPSGIATDLDGAPRITGAVDIGCYEFSGNAVASLVSTNLVEDQQGAYSVHSALSGELVFFLYSLVGTGPGPCLPGSNTICIQLLPSIIIGAAVVANTDGRAIHSVSVPMGMPPIDVWAQAVMLRGAGLANSVMTNVIHQTVQPKP